MSMNNKLKAPVHNAYSLPDTCACGKPACCNIDGKSLCMPCRIIHIRELKQSIGCHSLRLLEV